MRGCYNSMKVAVIVFLVLQSVPFAYSVAEVGESDVSADEKRLTLLGAPIEQLKAFRAVRDWKVMERLTSHDVWMCPGLREGTVSESDRLALLSFLLSVHAEIFHSIDPTLGAVEAVDAPNRPTLTVIPPYFGEPINGAVEPARIKDPVIRRKYEAMIAENDEKSARWNKQIKFLGIQHALSEFTLRYIERAFPGDARDKADAEIERTVKDKKLKEELMSKKSREKRK